MPSLRAQIISQVVSVLQAASTGANVYRSRETAITRVLAPATVVMPVGAEITKLGTMTDRVLFEFALEHFVRGDPWDQLADSIDIASHAALFASQPLADLLADLQRVSEQFEAQEADKTAGTLTVRYRATFVTSRRAIDKAG